MQLFIVLVALFGLMGCSKTLVTNRYQLMLVEGNQEIAKAKRLEKMILRRVKLSQDKEMTQRLNRVGKKISSVTDQYYNTQGYHWAFYLIENDEEINAFCLAGGKVFVYSGLLNYVQSDDELAIVLGHEIAHALSHHVEEKKSLAKVSKIFKGVLDFMVDLNTQSIPLNTRLEHKLVDGWIKEHILFPHSRTQEYEADHIGLILASKAGYDLDVAVDFWHRLSEEISTQKAYASTHPTPEDRMEKIQAFIITLEQRKI